MRDNRDNIFHSEGIHIWKELPEKARDVNTIMTFIRHLNRYMDRKGL